MKNKNIISDSIMFIILSIGMFNVANAKQIATLNIGNIKTMGHTIEMDITLTNDGTENLLLDAVALGININSAFLNNGKMKAEYIKDSRSSEIDNIGEYSISVDQHLNTAQLRLVNRTPGFFKAPEIAVGKSVSLGRFRIHNSLDWNFDIENPIHFQLKTENGLYGTKLLAYVGSDGTTTQVHAMKNNLTTNVESFSSRSVQDATGLRMDVSPNPVTTRLEVRVESNITGTGILEIQTIEGAKIFNLPMLLSKGTTIQQIDMATYPAGNYLVLISHEKDVLHQRITICK